MGFDANELAHVEDVMDAFLERRRPREEIRHELDLGYRIEGQSITIVEIRPQFMNPSVITEEPIAKTTYVRSSDVWKVFWMRADLKWHSYDPKPKVKTLQEFAKLVEADEYAAFFG